MPSIEKINSILLLLQKHNRMGLTNKDISETLKIPPSTCYRILAGLRKVDLVRQRKPDMRYVLGFAHLRFAESVLEGTDIAEICLPFLEDLHMKTEETTFFALLAGRSCVALEICGHINTRIAVGRGEVMPLHSSAAGKSVLAFLSRRERTAILAEGPFAPYTDRTVTDPARLEQELEEIRRTGVAYNFQEFHKGINALATPIFGAGNRVVGALAVVGTSADLDREQMEEYATLFREASEAITARLGAKFPVRKEGPA